jgi:hypothetical protein
MVVKIVFWGGHKKTIKSKKGAICLNMVSNESIVTSIKCIT